MYEKWAAPLFFLRFIILGLSQWSSMAFIMLEVLVVWLEYLFYKRHLICCSEAQRLAIIKYYVVIANITTVTMGVLIQI
ncbi:hypothetical protein [Cellulosilyticum lentocellum]|uniref:Uncharacterized protein n=1 Tax=Cellulosilyticum lentocellum (strain ATCC 49066 / DSM 5427 / NCIMB 11756 / RHM5) TaxID=642492 RepID=F2JHW6_CELLD|nr:hypothetical protein [Cellulosilyticum lentocellum]ADZ81910.1 hypothetical protein Clole_0153 [Cellulosilyticum lentocellum DSM 5427]